MKNVKHCMIIFLMALIMGFMLPQKAEASDNFDHEKATEMTFGETFTITRADFTKTSSSLGWSYSYYATLYVYAPCDLNVTFTCKTAGDSVELEKYNSSSSSTLYDGELPDGSTAKFTNFSCKYDKKSNTTTITADFHLKEGDNYLLLHRGEYTTQVDTYEVTLSAKLSTAPSISSVKETKSHYAKLTWNKLHGVNGYVIYRATSKNGKYTKVKTLTKNTNTWTDKKVKEGKTYYYKIKAYVKVDDVKIYSAYSAKENIKIKETATENDVISYPVAVNAKNFPDSIFREYVRDMFGASLSEEEAQSVQDIHLLGMGIESLQGIEFFPMLRYLDCRRNNLNSLDMSKNIYLEDLYCSQNNIKTLNVSQNLELWELECYENNLSSLDVSNNTKLWELDCSENNLTSLDVSENVELGELRCSSNKIASLTVSKNNCLQDLYCSGNNITSLDVSANPCLNNLDCSENKITNLDVSHNSELFELDCHSNKLTSLNVSENSDLFRLDCSENNLTSLNVSKNYDLNVLLCYSNSITYLNISGNPRLSLNNGIIHFECDDEVKVVK